MVFWLGSSNPLSWNTVVHRALSSMKQSIVMPFFCTYLPQYVSLYYAYRLYTNMYSYNSCGCFNIADSKRRQVQSFPRSASFNAWTWVHDGNWAYMEVADRAAGKDFIVMLNPSLGPHSSIFCVIHLKKLPTSQQ